jgi:hypothetical protein
VLTWRLKGLPNWMPTFSSVCVYQNVLDFVAGH